MDHDATTRALDKPRKTGLTMMLDKGLAPRAIEDTLQVAGDYIDIVKLGWGTALVTGALESKLEVYRSAGIAVYFGGTLLEYFLVRDEVDSYRKLVDKHGIAMVEVSDGTITIPHEKKLECIQDFCRDFRVVSEVGRKDEYEPVPPYRWIEMMEAELAAGSEYVITEARESGSGGVCRPSGELRKGLIDEIANAIDIEQIMFEAPTSSLQSWFIRKYGCNVNLGNIQPADVLSVETLRRGLRGDTLLDFLH